MKLICLFLVLTTVSTAFGQHAYHESIIEERSDKLEKLLDTSQNVLNTEDLKHFAETSYFPIDEAFIVEAVWKKSKGRKFKMPTSTERTPVYRRYGYLIFEIGIAVFRNRMLV